MDEPVADGGMGEVWRATDVSLGRTVAVKVLRPALLTDPGFDARFRAEARIMAALAHPNVVNVYDYGHSDVNPGASVAFLVMAYVDGEPLSRRIAEAGRLPVAETMSIVAQTAEALHAAHQHGIVHRDVKPANLLIQPSGMVTLVDFGIARSPAVTQVTTANAIIGTAMYMAPEQASGREVSPATDIYALGAVAYHCLAGHPPFTGEAPLEIALRHVSEEPPPLPADVPPAARQLVERTLAKDPVDRYPTAADLAAAARAVMAGRGAVGATARAATARAMTVRAPAVRPAATRSTAAAPAAVPAGRAGVPAASAEPGPPTAWEEAPARPPRRSPRAVLLVSAAAAALLVVAGLVAALSPSRPVRTSPAEGRVTSQAPAAPAGDLTTGTGEPPAASTTGVAAVPVGTGAQVSQAPAAPAPTGPSTAPATPAAPTTPAQPAPTQQPTVRPTFTQPAATTPPAPENPTPTGPGAAPTATAS
ncbi:protein kinase domain-containing protein [Planosporangium sp. 12N6]|uniref:serine/threonine-protein kinase n=1 Tax=Planosporangium spinosum TaxID=3402278 RepID=UPI003CEEAAC1